MRGRKLGGRRNDYTYTGTNCRDGDTGTVLALTDFNSCSNGCFIGFLHNAALVFAVFCIVSFMYIICLSVLV